MSLISQKRTGNLVRDRVLWLALTDAKLRLELLWVDKTIDLARVYEALSTQLAAMSTNYTATPSNASTSSTTAQVIV